MGNFAWASAQAIYVVAVAVFAYWASLKTLFSGPTAQWQLPNMYPVERKARAERRPGAKNTFRWGGPVTVFLMIGVLVAHGGPTAYFLSWGAFAGTVTPIFLAWVVLSVLNIVADYRHRS
jgi:hypothetical protein